MGEVLPLPSRGEVFLDPRGEGRSLRVSWHQDENTLVLSLWQFGQCRATFRLPSDQVPELVRALVAGLSDGLAAQQRNAQPPSESQKAAPIRKNLPTTGGAAEDGPTALVAVEPPTVPVAVEPPTVSTEAEASADPPDAATPDAESPTVSVDSEREPPSSTQTAERSTATAPAAIFIAPPAQA
jgi:hypothetical protein